LARWCLHTPEGPATSWQYRQYLRIQLGQITQRINQVYTLGCIAVVDHPNPISTPFLIFLPPDLTIEIAPAGDQDAPSKHGLRKVYKSEFHSDPERYVLREGFPDFPPCPFGQSFSILGFDTAEQEYVWLVTSIIRDPRLIRVPYQGEDVISDE
jgi:hypothetical protein